MRLTNLHSRLLLLALASTFGCNSAPKQPTLSTLPKGATVSNMTIRPTVPPPPFKLFHQSPTTLTLVTKENASDEDVEAILWQLRDAAHARSP